MRITDAGTAAGPPPASRKDRSDRKAPRAKVHNAPNAAQNAAFGICTVYNKQPIHADGHPKPSPRNCPLPPLNCSNCRPLPAASPQQPHCSNIEQNTTVPAILLQSPTSPAALLRQKSSCRPSTPPYYSGKKSSCCPKPKTGPNSPDVRIVFPDHSSPPNRLHQEQEPYKRSLLLVHRFSIADGRLDHPTCPQTLFSPEMHGWL